MKMILTTTGETVTVTNEKITIGEIEQIKVITKSGDVKYVLEEDLLEMTN